MSPHVRTHGCVGARSACRYRSADGIPPVVPFHQGLVGSALLPSLAPLTARHAIGSCLWLVWHAGAQAEAGTRSAKKDPDAPANGDPDVPPPLLPPPSGACSRRSNLKLKVQCEDRSVQMVTQFGTTRTRHSSTKARSPCRSRLVVRQSCDDHQRLAGLCSNLRSGTARRCSRATFWCWRSP